MKRTRCVGAVLCVLGLLGLAGCTPPESAGPAVVQSTAPPESLPASANGIAFVRNGSAFVIVDGSAREIVADGVTKVAVGYSTDGGSLLVTEEQATRRVVLLAPLATPESGSVVLDYSDGSTLGGVRAVPKSGQLYYSVYGDPAARLVASGPTSGSKTAEVALQGTFSGEFDVDSTGAIVYTGSSQNPATVMMRTGTEERPLVSSFALAFTPGFSRDGERVCFTGSERSGEPISVWIVDRVSGKLQAVAGTGSLKPTFPVLSPDGGSVAFRSGVDGSIWVAPLLGGEPQKLQLTCDEAPIGW